MRSAKNILPMWKKKNKKNIHARNIEECPILI